MYGRLSETYPGHRLIFICTDQQQGFDPIAPDTSNDPKFSKVSADRIDCCRALAHRPLWLVEAVKKGAKQESFAI